MTDTHHLNADLGQFAAADTNTLDWQASPSGTVWRKRLHLSGAVEAGRVTSVVRYEPGASFHSHPHPEGEEILVLDGVFSDEHGDWPAGTYLLNPEGFEHAPFSRDGCVLFVKLRQYAGARDHYAIETDDVPWTPGERDGVSVRSLYVDPAFTDTMAIEHWGPTTDAVEIANPAGLELFIIEGGLRVGPPNGTPGSWPAGAWLRFPAGHSPRLSAPSGAKFYVKRGHLV